MKLIRGRGIRSSMMNRCRVVRCRSGVHRGRVVRSGSRVNGGRVVRSRVRVRFDSFVRADFTLIFDISVVLFVLINIIIDNLGTTIRQFHGILSWKEGTKKGNLKILAHHYSDLDHCP